MVNSERRGGKNPQPKNLGREPKIKTIKLADGNEYKLAVLNLNLMVEIEEALGDKFATLFSEGAARNIRYLLYATLKVNYPELTIERVGELVTAQILVEAYEKIAEMIGA